MSAPRLIPYAGKDTRERSIVWEAGRLRRKALHLFKEGLRTDQIARSLYLKESEVANALAVARDKERVRQSSPVLRPDGRGLGTITATERKAS